MDLINAKYFDECRIYRVIPGFICQWGIPANPDMYREWGDNKIMDDPVKVSNTRGTMSFATSGPNARGSQVFINYSDDNAQLDSQGFAPFAVVVDGISVAEKICVPAADQKPDQGLAKVSPDRPSMRRYGCALYPTKWPLHVLVSQQKGNAYFVSEFPNLSYIKSTYIK